MQFLSMLLHFHTENETNIFSSKMSFALFVNFFDNSYFAELLSETCLEPSPTSAMELFYENS